MDIKESLSNNRSRVAAALTAIVTALVYVVGDYFDVDQDTLNHVATAVIPVGVAYILGNGYYESQKLLVSDIPVVPPKPTEKGKK